MNTLLSFFLAPVTAFFLPRVYGDAAKSSVLKGVLYITYVSLLFAGLIQGIFMERLSISDEFIHWIKKEIPVVLWTPEGLSLENGQRTALLTHPVHGPIAVFDMDRKDITENDMGQLYFFLTSRKIYFRKITGQLDVRDVTKTTLKPGELAPGPVRFTGKFIENYYRKGKYIFIIVTPAVIFLSSFIVFLIVSLIYSAIGLLLNLMRTRRLGYGAIFNLACFSTGIALVLTGLISFFQLPEFLVLMSFLISLFYMLAAVTLITDKTG